MFPPIPPWVGVVYLYYIQSIIFVNNNYFKIAINKVNKKQLATNIPIILDAIQKYLE